MEEKGEVCALCEAKRMRTSRYTSWKNVASKKCAKDLGVDAESPRVPYVGPAGTTFHS